MPYIWQQSEWPTFRFDTNELVGPVVQFTKRRTVLLAKIAALGLETQVSLAARALAEDAQGTSAVEGEPLAESNVRSSVARRLGLDTSGLPEPTREVEGLVAVLDDATREHAKPLTAERLHGWHAALFPTGHSSLRRIVVADWRNTDISVQSGVLGKERTHFEAPPADAIPGEIEAFLTWWNAEPTIDGALRAGLAHLWFETLHPYEDGNGRIGRAILDMALAQEDSTPRRFYSLSRQILVERDAYYEQLEEAQSGSLDVTAWLIWLLECAGRAVAHSEAQAATSIRRAALKAELTRHALQPRQVKVLTKLIEVGPSGFEGGMTNVKYRSITGVSKATAARDLSELVGRGLLTQSQSGGRSTRYGLTASAFEHAIEAPIDPS